jgi:cinnamyl-alcohol dehydrogenase
MKLNFHSRLLVGLLQIPLAPFLPSISLEEIMAMMMLLSKSFSVVFVILIYDWGFTTYPVEIVGEVTKIGNNVKNFKVGDKVGVGVGVMVESCQTCENCQQDLDNYCPKLVFTYNSPYKGTRTYGGYSDFVVVHQRYVLQFPANLPLAAGAPLLCAGITVYSPMLYYVMTEPGKYLGVAGLGG